MRTASVLFLLTGTMFAAGCASATAPTAATEGCVENASAPLKTCAKATTLKGVDISSYQGTVSFTKVKAAGNEFAFTRISDGLNSIDSTFQGNWPAMKTAGLVRGSYQFFRPSQDAGLQAKLVLDKLAAAGGLGPGDLPPVLDLETADGQSSSVVIAKATKWLGIVEAAIGMKPIVYTASFMSSVIGETFAGYRLWVANYQTSCPTMPTGWTDWHFWQNAEDGSVTGISGATDTDFFNGTLPELKALTLPTAATGVGAASVDVSPPDTVSQGATLGSGTPPTDTTTGATVTPCQ